MPAPAALAGGYPDNDIVVFAVQPTTVQAGQAVTPTVVVNVGEPNAAPDSDYNGPVTISYAVNKVGAPEPENNVAQAADGVASFPGLAFTAIGFGFRLQASIPGGTSPPSQAFDVVTQLVHCPAGQPCQSQTVSDAGTSAFATAGAAPTDDVLTATGGGFPRLSCTSLGGVVSFSVTSRPKVIMVMLSRRLVQQAHRKGVPFFNICWGSPTPFTTKDGTTSQFNPANGEYEGLLPDCRCHQPQPCIVHRSRGRGGQEAIKVEAPPGDPHITS